MQTDKQLPSKHYQVELDQKLKGYRPNALGVGRYLIGRSEGCDIIIPHGSISSVHAVLEITPNGFSIYDMNSKHGTFVGDKKTVASQIALGESIKLGPIALSLKEYKPKADLPPVLPSLEAEAGSASILKQVEVPKVPKTEEKPSSLPQATPEIADEIPYIVYPLSADPKSDYSEYIFEDSSELYPIFKYEHNKQAVEVMIIFRDKVYSVDYLPEKDGTYQIAGLTSKSEEIEFPYLGKQEKVPFVEISKGNCNVYQLHNYELWHLKDKNVEKSNSGVVNIQQNDIVKLRSGELEIYVRKITSPPKVKPAPFFRRDKDLRKYVIFMLLLVFIPLLALNFIEVDKEKDDQKDPERIATILYKQKLTINKNKTVEQSKKKPVKKQTAKKKPVVKKSKPKKSQATSQKSEVKKQVTKNPGSSKAKKVQKVKRVKDPAPKKNNASKVASKSPSKSNQKSVNRKRYSNVRNNNKGRVDVYKSMDFKSSVSSLMAKGGSISGVRTAQTSSSVISTGAIGGGVATNVNKAKVGTQVGSLTGSTTGTLGESKGTEGLSAKTGVYTAGIPSETVVLGSMDPDVIRRILRDNIPFFRSCYQKELDRNGGRDISGTVKLNFLIGASGHVTRAGVEGQSSLPGRVKTCVVGVLRGIKFPSPMGGGTVDVKQPFNFYPKKI